MEISMKVLSLMKTSVKKERSNTLMEMNIEVSFWLVIDMDKVLCSMKTKVNMKGDGLMINRHGIGKYYSEGKEELYEGMFVNDKKEGNGTLI